MTGAIPFAAMSTATSQEVDRAMAEIAALLCGVFLGAIVSGIAGFAFSAVAGAILLHVFSPAFAIPLLMICSVITQVATLTALRRSIRWNETLFLLVGGAVGVTVASMFFSAVSANARRTAFGAFLVAYSAYQILKRVRVSERIGGPFVESAFGFAAGSWAPSPRHPVQSQPSCASCEAEQRSSSAG